MTLSFFNVRDILREMSVKASVPGEDLCVSSPLINISAQSIFCNFLEDDVDRFPVLFIYFPLSLQRFL